MNEKSFLKSVLGSPGKGGRCRVCALDSRIRSETSHHDQVPLQVSRPRGRDLRPFGVPHHRRPPRYPSRDSLYGVPREGMGYFTVPRRTVQCRTSGNYTDEGA